MSVHRDILVIDDERVVLEGVARICESENWSYDLADTGADGIESLKKRLYRFVLCDIMMEGVDGFEILETVRTNGIRSPIVMTTGYSTVENAVRSLQRGAMDYLAKPFTVDEFIAVVKRGFNQESSVADPSPGARLPEGCHALGRMSWVKIEREGIARVGAQDSFLRAIQDPQALNLQDVGSDIIQGMPCAMVTDGCGLTHRMLAPVSGEIVEANTAMMSQIENLIADPHEAGWLYRILPQDFEYSLSCLAARPDRREGEAP